jgi:hypothetical protein
MLYDITTLKDVETFIGQIADEINDFHPLEDFTNYVYPESYLRRYTDEEAAIRNKQLDKCFNVCSKFTPDFFTYLLNLFQLERASLAF